MFVSLIPIIVIATYLSVDYIYNSVPSENTLFIWGDSQAYRGLDLEILRNKTHKKIFSAAAHGAGVYHFLVFADKIPPSSDVLVTISKPAQLRMKERDRNKAGISIFAIKNLFKYGYTLGEIIKILKINDEPEKIFSTHSNLYSSTSKIDLTDQIENFKRVYEHTPSYLAEKQKLIMEGVNLLMEKGCRVHFIEFPFHPLAEAIENNSEITYSTNKFKYDLLANTKKDFSVDTIYIDSGTLAMRDLTHLNKLGASIVSNNLAKAINNSNIPDLYTVKLCN